ncbi:MAG: hypothetical protein COT73_12465, partial [Bdellovibrio sp. CG10_big_fil_rev_8_21_14_0_10_47_8]
DGHRESPAQVKFGNHVKLGDRCWIGAGAGERFSIGDYSSTHGHCYLFGDISIGRYCLLSANIFISSGDHHFSLQPELYIRDQDVLGRQQEKSSGRPVVIEDDCWIGWGAVLKSGITVGKGSIIGANSVVGQDIPPYSIAVGAPAKVIKKRLEFSPPVLLEAAQSAHYPYLYRGFLHGQNETRRIEDHLVVPMSESSLAVLGKGDFSRGQISLWSDREQNIDVTWSGRRLSLSLSAGWNETEIRLEAGDLSERPTSPSAFFEGLNVLEFRHSSKIPLYFKRIEIFQR